MDYKVMVKKLRNKMFLTQSEFAKELGVVFNLGTGAIYSTFPMYPSYL